jgi:hypothetical protein
MNNIIHSEKHPLAGKWVKIKPGVEHFQYPDFGGSEIRIEDWADRVMGKPWGVCAGNPGCMVYALRFNTPKDDEVIYGHRKDGFGSLVHISELEL